MSFQWQSEPLNHSLQLHEFHCTLTLQQIYWGDNPNQQGIISSSRENSWGGTNVNDWALNQNGKTVARAKGLHIQSSMGAVSWHCSFDIVFEGGAGWFEGSTLQVMGPNVDGGEWSIVGGTGKLTMARGIIYKDGNNKLEINAFYIPMKRKKDQPSRDETNVWKW